MIFRAMFSRKWILTTLLVLAGGVLCIRLGIWQLDRLDQRRAFNAHFIAMQSALPLDLNLEIPQDLTDMEYRHVQVTGTYDFTNQVALRNQYYGSEYGYHLLTPLRLDDGSAVLVDRGWVPADGNDSPGGWSRYDETGQVEVQGVMRLGPYQAGHGRRPRSDSGAGTDASRLSGILPIWNASRNRFRIRFYQSTFSPMWIRTILPRRYRTSPKSNYPKDRTLAMLCSGLHLQPYYIWAIRFIFADN